MRRIALIVTLALLGASVIFWFSRSYAARWEPQLRAQIEERVGAALKARLQIRAIKISFLHKASLQDVELWDTQTQPETRVFQAKEVALTVSLIDLPRALYRRKPLESIGLITLHEPHVLLSPEWAHEHAPRKKSSTTPLWFSVEWINGTFQWADPLAPHGQWEMTKANGFFKIRGPRMEVRARGVVEHTEAIDVHIATLGKRWSAEAKVTQGDIPGLLAVSQRFIQKPFLPEAWKLQGRFDFTVEAAGRGPFSETRGVGAFIQEARLQLFDAQIDLGRGPNAPPLQLNGKLLLKGPRLDVSGFSIKAEDSVLKFSGHALPFTKPAQLDFQATNPKIPLSLLSRYIVLHSTPTQTPLLDGNADLTVSVKGPAPRLAVVVQAKVAEGRLWRWPFQNASLQIRRVKDRWEIDPSTVKIWDGQASLKGQFSEEQTEMQLTGEAMSLQSLSAFAGKETLNGQMHFSVNVRGAKESLRTTGSFWMNHFAWARNTPTSIKGELDISATQFKIQASSDDESLKIQLIGTNNSKMITLEQALIQLREGTTFNSQGTYFKPIPRIRLFWSGKNLSLAQDVPQLQTRFPSLQGRADLLGSLEGPLTAPLLKLDVQSPDLRIGAAAPSKTAFSIRRSSEELQLDAAHSASETSGTFTAKRIHPNTWDLKLALSSMLGKADLKGQAIQETAEKITYHGDGRFSSSDQGASWEIPTRFRGQVNPTGEKPGDLTFEAPAIKLNTKTAEPLEAHVRWNRKEVVWNNFRWGRRLTSEGAVRFADDKSVLSGYVKAIDLDLPRWQGLLWPNIKEPVQGTLTGNFTLDGSLNDPLLQFSGKVANGVWRAFRFETSVAGTWKNRSFEPLTLDATLKTGGRVRFQGRVSLIEKTASGSVDVSQFQLRPIAESLSFPRSLDSTANGTLTVSGPINQLRFAGHIEGGPLAYGGETPTPFKLQHYVMDMKLEPGPDPAVTRLTITQLLAKTQEEEIRLQPGSFVEFAGRQEARLQIGTEIRNLHLGVFTFFGGLDMNGTWQIKPEGFALQGDLFTRSLFINDYQLEQGKVQASYYNRVLSFEPPRGGPTLVTGIVDFKSAPQLSFKDFAVVGRHGEGLRLTGEIGPKKWDFSMSGEGLDLSTLGGLSGFPYPLEGSAKVKIRGIGDLEHPNVEGTVDVEDGRVLGLSFRDGSAAFAWQGQRMTFTRLQLTDPGRYTLTGTGIFPLATKAKNTTADKTIDFSVRLTDSNLGLLQSISREVKSAKGSVQALVQVTGTSEAPKLRGSLRIKNGDIVGAHYFRHLSDFHMAIDFDGNDLIVSELRGASGRGEFTGGGHIMFSGFEPKFYDLHVEVPSAKGIEVTIPELAIPDSPLAKRLRFLTQSSQGDVKGQVTFRGPADAPVFYGLARISNGHFTFPPSRKNPPPPGFTEWVHRILWDIELRMSDEAWFENELVEANLSGALTIKGPHNKLRVDGGMDISEGKISYLGVDFDIRQARFEMHSSEAGSAIANIPYVRGIADSHVQTIDPLSGSGIDDTITLTINYAPISEIKPQMRSSLNPELAQDKLLARVTQLEVENLNPQERTYLYQQQMVRLLDTSLATPLAKNVLKRTGLVDELRVSRVINPANAPTTSLDPNNPNAGQQQDTMTNFLAGTKYTVAKNLSNRISLGYGVRFEQLLNEDLTNKLDLRSDVEMSYRFLSNVYLRGSFDLPNQTAGTIPERKVMIEPHWRFGWWGNTNKPKTPRATGTPVTPPTENK